MPTFYNYMEGGQAYSFDDVFVPADAFRQGNLWAWGINNRGQLGTNDITDRNTPVTTLAGGANWKQVSCGYEYTMAVKTDGTLWTWGRNSYGILGINVSGVGNGSTNGRTTPVTTFAGGTNWKQVACGQYHAAAIKTDGTLWVWGRNNFGRLGINNVTSPICTPVTTFAGGNNWKQVTAGNYHTAAIKTDGTLWAWGANFSGEVGDNTATQRNTPVTTFAGGTNWKQVASVGDAIGSVKNDGTLWTWGRNIFGALGDNGGLNRSTPITTFAGGTNWKQVAGGGYHMSAVKTDGTLWTWGRNDGGQLGDNSATNSSIPIATFAGGTNWKQVDCGDKHTAAVKTDGTLWTWGFNVLGNNTVSSRYSPVTTFLGGTIWKQVQCGYRHMAATTYIDDYQ